MTAGELIPLRPDIAAAIRGGDSEQGMETEADPPDRDPRAGRYWRADPLVVTSRIGRDPRNAATAADGAEVVSFGGDVRLQKPGGPR